MATSAAAIGAILAHLPVESGLAVVRRGDTTVIGAGPSEVVRADGEDAFTTLDSLAPAFWVGTLAYELGHTVERVAGPPREADRPADLLLARFEARLVLPDNGPARFEGGGTGLRLLERACTWAGDPLPPPALTGWRSSIGRTAYEAGVRAIAELIRAGEVYQVNLTRRLATSEWVDPRALFTAIATRHPAPHACLVALDGEAVVSASPERFLAWRGRDVETRPIKGTAAERELLAASTKDRAENVMIVDLARNDLGRVCEYGSVHVPGLCDLEAHPGLFHLVSTVRGRLRPEVGLGALVRAVFPPASVTGAPKPRVLQAIADLEPVPRGVYCGAVGWLDTAADEGDLAVAIRTFRARPGGTQLGVGAGITADSDPAAEWEETELKAARLIETAGAGLLVTP